MVGARRLADLGGKSRLHDARPDIASLGACVNDMYGRVSASVLIATRSGQTVAYIKGVYAYIMSAGMGKPIPHKGVLIFRDLHQV